MSKPTPEQMALDGRPLACVVCGGDCFTKRNVTMITSGAANTGFNKVAEPSLAALVDSFTTSSREW